MKQIWKERVVGDDVGQAFSDIHRLPEDLRKQMFEISQHVRSKEGAQNWARNLHFLIQDQVDEIKGSYVVSLERGLRGHQSNSQEAGCACKKLLSFANDTSLSLRLGGRNDFPDCIHYIAVSYCWRRKDVPELLPPTHPHAELLVDGYDTRSIRAPSTVLDRAISYAVHHDIRAIWIDQECIDQSDPEDKQVGIQAMDLVYQRASHPLAILNTYIETQNQMDAFAAMVKGSSCEPSQLEGMDEVLEMLTDDQWFYRAWTLQESTSAEMSMFLLIGCDYQLDKPAFFGTLPGEIEIDIEGFQDALINSRCMIEELLASSEVDKGTATYASNNADILWNLMPTKYPNWPEDDFHRQSCNAAQATTFLENRENSVFSDRLAILANLCNYEKRIDTMVMETGDYGFSTCALTLATLNGDTSLLGGYNLTKQRTDNFKELDSSLLFANDRRNTGGNYYTCKSSSLSYGFSWGPDARGCLNNIEYLEENSQGFRVRPATLSMDGLALDGLLWQMSHWIPLPTLQKQFASRFQQEIRKQEIAAQHRLPDFEYSEWHALHDSATDLIREFVWSLILHLVDAKLLELAQTLWNYFQPVGKSNGSPSTYAPYRYSFATIFRLPSSPCFPLEASLALSKAYIRANLRSDPVLIGKNHSGPNKASVSLLLIEQVCNSGGLLCGSPVGCSTDEEAYVVFDSCKKGDFVFTPSTELGDKTAITSEYRNEALSWKVVHTGSTSGQHGILHCSGRKRGLWRVDGLPTKTYVLD